jgi:NADH-quinone oxidoreductase subunit M
VGTFQFNPWTAAVAAFVMILAAAYLLWMYQRVAMGEPSEFLVGLGDHLHDIRPVEVVTLLPLGVLVVALGLVPGLVLGLVEAPVESVLHDAAAGSPIAIDPAIVAAAAGLIAAAVVVRLASFPARGRSRTTAGEAAA